MTHPGAERLQDWLDGLLAPAVAAEIETHVHACPVCAHDVALYREVFAALDAVPLTEPAPAFLPRVLDHVLPSRIRRRRLRALGWGYAGFAAAAAALAVLARVPAARQLIEHGSATVSHALLQGGMFVIDTLSLAALRALAGWALLQSWAVRLAPLGHALAEVARQPSLLMLVWGAVVASAALLWWIRPRDTQVPEDVRHVGLLGF